MRRKKAKLVRRSHRDCNDLSLFTLQKMSFCDFTGPFCSSVLIVEYVSHDMYINILEKIVHQQYTAGGVARRCCLLKTECSPVVV